MEFATDIQPIKLIHETWVEQETERWKKIGKRTLTNVK